MRNQLLKHFVDDLLKSLEFIIINIYLKSIIVLIIYGY
jgi:hypothetical protein